MDLQPESAEASLPPPPPPVWRTVLIRFLAALMFLMGVPFVGIGLGMAGTMFLNRFDLELLLVASLLLVIGAGLLIAGIQSFRKPGSVFAVAAPVAIMSLLIAIAIPNIQNASGRGSKQKRTMADMRSIATAWEARATDYNRYNAAGYAEAGPPVAQRDLEMMIAPTYIRSMPKKDGWGHPWKFGMDEPIGATNPAQRYSIVSFGKDGKQQRDTPEGPTTNFNCDIVYKNGVFTVYPEGVQAN